MKTKNQRIAEYMEDKKALSVYRHPKYLPSDDTEYVKYHKDISWLMPVIQKIYINDPRAFRYSLEDGAISPLAKLHIYDSIEIIYQAVVEYLDSIEK